MRTLSAEGGGCHQPEARAMTAGNLLVFAGSGLRCDAEFSSKSHEWRPLNDLRSVRCIEQKDSKNNTWAKRPFQLLFAQRRLHITSVHHQTVQPTH